MAEKLEPSSKTLLSIKWCDQEGHKQSFRLIDRVDVKWREFGALLEISDSHMDAWEEQYSQKAHKCWQKVMHHWLKGTGGFIDQYPDTWKGLYALLRDVNCSDVAEELEEVIKTLESK